MRSLRAASVSVVVAAGIFVAAMTTASAQQIKYPVDTVTAVTYSTVGGGTDVFLREMTKYLTPILGVNFVVENVTGGSGARAMAKIATSTPNGSTILGTTITIVNTSVIHRPKYKWDDMDMILMYAVDPTIAYVRAESPFKSLGDVIAYAKANPGKLNFGLPNPTAMDRWVLEQLKKKVPGFSANAVSFEGGGDLMLSVLNGTVDIAHGEPAELRGQLQAGKLRAIAVWAEERLDIMPDLPTAKEQGIDLVVEKFRGLAGPKGLPKDIVDAWYQAFTKLIANPDFKAWLDRGGISVKMRHQAEYTKFMRELADRQEAFFSEIGLVK